MRNENQLFMIRAIIVYNALPDLYKVAAKPANPVMTVNHQAALEQSEPPSFLFLRDLEGSKNFEIFSNLPIFRCLPQSISKGGDGTDRYPAPEGNDHVGSR